MIKNIFVVVTVLLYSGLLQSQTDYFRNYKVLEAQGTIPSDFLETSRERYEKNAGSVAVDQGRASRKAEDRFFEINGYSSEMIRFSGRILLNDTVTGYLNRVVDRLLKEMPRLRNRISIYTMRSAAVNAFATPDGMIMVNLGLLTRLKTEDELAFILAHEVAHIYKQHSRNNYMQKHRFEVGTNTSKDYERSWEYHSYSQFSEMQADSLGYDLFVKAGYNPAASLSAMGTLGYADYPYSNAKLNLEQWQTKRFRFPTEIIKSDYCEPKRDDGGGEQSTHPALSDREEQLQSFILQKADSLIKQNSEMEFIKEIALFECAKLYNQEGDWVNGFYHTSQLLTKYPDNVYLERELARSCLIAGICRNRKKMDYYKIECGEALRFYQLVYQQSEVQSNSMLLRMVWDLHLKHPEDKDIQWYAFGLMTELVVKNNTKSVFFNTKEHDFLTQIGLNDSAGVREIDSAYTVWVDQCYLDQNKKLYRYSFQREQKDDLFLYLFDKAESILTSKDEADILNEVMDKLIGEKPNSNGMLSLTPFGYYENLSRKKEESINFKKMARIRSDITESIVNSSIALNMPVKIMNPTGSKNNSTADYNMFGVLSEWVDCHIVFEDSSIVVKPFPITAIKHLEERSGGSSVINSGYIQLQAAREFEPYAMIAILYAVSLPNIAWSVTKPRFAAAYYFQVLDLRTGRVLYNDFSRTDHQVYRRSLIATHIHHSLRKAKSK